MDLNQYFFGHAYQLQVVKEKMDCYPKSNVLVGNRLVGHLETERLIQSIPQVPLLTKVRMLTHTLFEDDF